MKYFIFSIDDGTLFDKKVIDIFNKYNIKATFNLNSGLSHFVWYFNDDINKPVYRPDLMDVANIYQGHDIASHSYSHPYMTSLSNEDIYQEVYKDISRLKEIFKKDISVFAFPFEDYDERTIDIIKDIEGIKLIRISELDSSFRFPIDRYHIKITSWDINETLNLMNDFINDKEAELFVFVAHAYDFEYGDSYSKLEELCQIVASNKDIKIISMSELDNLLD